MVQQYAITLSSYPRGFHLVTREVLQHISELPESGIFHVFIQHTSAALTINENADPSVRVDFESSMNHIVREDEAFYTHTLEGADDMPAHIKSSLMGASLSIPITNHHLNMGTWQGIYLCEFRNHGGNRNIIVTVYS